MLPNSRKSLPMGGRQWGKLTKDQTFLAWVQGYQIPLLRTPYQNLPPSQPKLNRKQHQIVTKEVENMMELGVIQKVMHTPGEIICNIFIKEKREKGHYRPIINLKPLNVFIPHELFKMETLKNVKDLLQIGDFLVKINLKNAYYAVNLAKESRKFVRFQ